MRLVLVLIAILIGLPLPAGAAVTTVHHRLDVRLDPQNRSLEATDEIRIDGGSTVVFRLAANFTLTAFTVDGENRAIRRNGDAWSVDLGPRGSHTASVTYAGKVAGLSADGGFLDPTVGWYPDVGAAEFSYDMTVQVPTPQVAVAPGRMLDEVRGERSYRVRLASERLSSGIVLITGPYKIAEKQHGEIRIRTYFIDDLMPFSKGYLESTADYLSLYEKRIGDYPFSAFRIVSGPLPVGLGFAGMTYIGETVLRLPFIRTTSLGHEVLHSWWGNGVEVDYASGNWAEGLTTYMADYAYAEARGPDEARKMRIAWLRDYAALPATRERPAKDFISRRHDAGQVVGYNKVAFIFHMLKRRIGDAAFDAGLRRFWRDHKFSSAAWSDLRHAFEATSKQDLGIFFDQWIARTGAAALTLDGAHPTPGGVAFAIGQTGAPYQLTLPVTLTTDDGDTKHRVRVTGEQTPVQLTAQQPVRGLTIDPDFDVFRRLSPGESPPILRDTIFATDTVTLLATDDAAMGHAAGGLADRLLDKRSGAGRTAGATAMLVIGSSARVGDFLKSRGLPPTPENIANAGTARAWAAQWMDGAGIERPLLVVEADDLTALNLIQRPLPHYGRQGYLVFEGSKVIKKGQWPDRAGPLSVRFD